MLREVSSISLPSLELMCTEVFWDFFLGYINKTDFNRHIDNDLDKVDKDINRKAGKITECQTQAEY